MCCVCVDYGHYLTNSTRLRQIIFNYQFIFGIVIDPKLATATTTGTRFPMFILFFWMSFMCANHAENLTKTTQLKFQIRTAAALQASPHSIHRDISTEHDSENYWFSNSIVQPSKSNINTSSLARALLIYFYFGYFLLSVFLGSAYCLPANNNTRTVHGRLSIYFNSHCKSNDAE